MAATELTVRTPGRTGVLTSAADAADVANGNKFDNDGKTLLYVAKGAGGASVTLTFSMTPTAFGDAVTAQTTAVTTTEDTVIGPFPVDRFNQSGDDAGSVVIAFGGSDTTNVTLLPVH